MRAVSEPTEQLERELWSQGYLEAEIWCCGDDHCACTQPQIVNALRTTIQATLGSPRDGWEGTFHTEALGEEIEAQIAN